MIDVDKADFKKELAKLKDLPESFFPDIKAAFLRLNGTLVREMIGQSSTGPLQRRTGDLARSWASALSDTKLGNLVAEVWSGSKYAAIHQFGGIIRAKRAKYLAIPLSTTPAGVARGGPRTVQGKTFVQRSKRGNLLIFKANEGGGATPLFVLKKQVTIPKRLTFYEKAGEFLDKLIRGFGR